MKRHRATQAEMTTRRAALASIISTDGPMSVRRDPRVPVVLNIGDHDPHGLEIEADLRRKLSDFGGSAFEWSRIGVTWDQIELLDLPGTTPKKEYGFPTAVEAEALPPGTIRGLLDNAITDYVDADQFDVLLASERSEREVLLGVVGSS